MNWKVCFSIFSFLLVLIGCSHNANTKGTHILRLPKSENITTAKFEEELSREVYLAGGNYHIVAFPYTEAYIKAYIKEHSSQVQLKSKEKREAFQRLKKKYIDNKTCFKFRYSVLRFNEVGQLKDWQVTFKNASNLEAQLNWDSNPKRDPSFAKAEEAEDFVHEKWIGDGIACSVKKLPLNKSFRLKVKPQYVQFPFDSHGDLFWDIP